MRLLSVTCCDAQPRAFFCFTESRPSRGFHDNQLRPRECDRLHEAFHEPRHQHPVQGNAKLSCSLKQPSPLPKGTVRWYASSRINRKSNRINCTRRRRTADCQIHNVSNISTLYNVLSCCHICTGLLEMIVGVWTACRLVLQMQHHVISFNGVTSRNRFMFLLFPQVSRNWRYESEPPFKPSPLTYYKQFGTNSIIVLMSVESQRVHM